MTDELPLGSEFPPATAEQWRKLVAAVLKSASFDERLVRRTYDGLRVEPLYPPQRDAAAIPFPRTGSAWTILQRVDHPRPADANAEALHDIVNGATGLALIFAGAAGGYGYGLPLDEEAISRALQGVDFGRTLIDIDCHALPAATAKLMGALCKRRSIAAPDANIRFGFDPVGAMSASGGAALAGGEIGSVLCAGVHALLEARFRGPFEAR